jgi:hypothetical protein
MNDIVIILVDIIYYSVVVMHVSAASFGVNPWGIHRDPAVEDLVEPYHKKEHIGLLGLSSLAI